MNDLPAHKFKISTQSKKGFSRNLTIGVSVRCRAVRALPHDALIPPFRFCFFTFPVRFQHLFLESCFFVYFVLLVVLHAEIRAKYFSGRGAQVFNPRPVPCWHARVISERCHRVVQVSTGSFCCAHFFILFCVQELRPNVFFFFSFCPVPFQLVGWFVTNRNLFISVSSGYPCLLGMCTWCQDPCALRGTAPPRPPPPSPIPPPPLPVPVRSRSC